MTSNPQAAPRSASRVLARLSAQQMLDGYRSKRFTPRDVLDEVIVALQATDSLCNVMATDMFRSARIDAGGKPRRPTEALVRHRLSVKAAD
jgi:aspartyl-tRNA(Asn)/glutamyl-tRNA(Gln) amidotransferase subunit A